MMRKEELLQHGGLLAYIMCFSWWSWYWPAWSSQGLSTMVKPIVLEKIRAAHHQTTQALSWLRGLAQWLRRVK